MNILKQMIQIYSLKKIFHHSDHDEINKHNSIVQSRSDHDEIKAFSKSI